MKGSQKPTSWITYFQATRPTFLTASMIPVAVGTAAGMVAGGGVDWAMFIAAMAGVVFLHAGANVINDYYDHLSGDDWYNISPTPFSGGRRFIQTGILSPRQTQRLGLVLLGIGACIGLCIVAIKRSLFILLIGLAGTLGGYFYTARPIQIGYRGIGEISIGLLFGLLPVYGSYYLQTSHIDLLPLGPALIISLLIFLVILINEFPDRDPDRLAGKKTLVVLLGPKACIQIYRMALLSTVIVALLMAASSSLGWAGLASLLTLPLVVLAWRQAGLYQACFTDPTVANRTTLILHATAGLALVLGLVMDALCQAPISLLP
ncbi:MAG: 1,4-dihydroxy-2-naphthoate octaprenyltransferase [Sedimentisphaerales bacterium]|nr:1,4-dihydroxy-2-naphthoate octaprenyltransferase [Sedimentisphaerales bacterium]